VVAGGHATLPLAALADRMPERWAELQSALGVLEAHYQDMVDVEFTIEANRLWILQARSGKRSPAAAARLAVDCQAEFNLPKSVALARAPAGLLTGEIRIEHATAARSPIAVGLGVSPGIATGRIVLDPDSAVEAAESGEDVILVRRETSPEDVHGMAAAKGVLTTLGGLMSHAAVVARAWGLPAVCGAEGIELLADGLRIGEALYPAGSVISLDGASGQVFAGAIAGEATADPYLATLQAWAAELQKHV
jgi:pyruvate, orthophosphate dikinase